MSIISQSRADFHQELKVLEVLTQLRGSGIPSNSDKNNQASIRIATGICNSIGGVPQVARKIAGQTLGVRFEVACRNFLRSTFPNLGILRPGVWDILHVGSDGHPPSAQYAHLSYLLQLAAQNPGMQAALGSDYFIKPDVLIMRSPEPDSTINHNLHFVDASEAVRADIREGYQPMKLMHACISCKWTMRSDRAQNTRTEALNLIRNRKGRTPHVVALTAEPMPSRLSSLALGTGDIDCTYHFALPELIAAVNATEGEDSIESLNIMLEGKRLKDISDLPLDLAV